MPSKHNTVRKYSFSDAQLKQIADQVLMLMTRDAAAFNNRNIDNTKFDEFQAAINVFHNIKADEILAGQSMTATEEKNNCRQLLIQKMRTVILMAKFVFGTNTSYLRSFGKADFTRQNDNTLLRNAQNIIITCRTYQTQLAVEGMTVLFMQELELAKKDFGTAIQEQITAKHSRDIATCKRVKAGNELYALLTKYARLGKDIWYSTHEALYNDYIISDMI